MARAVKPCRYCGKEVTLELGNYQWKTNDESRSTLCPDSPSRQHRTSNKLRKA